jgi:16S rRNA (uracil1498-N3)-methyltransferase
VSHRASSSADAAPPWFHLAALPGVGEVIELAASEAAHASGARRLRPGAAVVLFDGAGTTAEATLLAGHERALAARILSQQRHVPERPAIHLASALPKGDRLAQLLGMATQLGMSAFTPLVWRRGVVKPKAGHDARRERLVREACKQSRRPQLPALHEPADPVDYAQSLPAATPLFLLSPDGEPAHAVLTAAGVRQAPEIHLLVGPEGGLDDEETLALEASGARRVALGPGVLRIETAAVAAISIFSTLRKGR